MCALGCYESIRKFMHRDVFPSLQSWKFVCLYAHTHTHSRVLLFLTRDVTLMLPLNHVLYLKLNWTSLMSSQDSSVNENLKFKTHFEDAWLYTTTDSKVQYAKLIAQVDFRPNQRYACNRHTKFSTLLVVKIGASNSLKVLGLYTSFHTQSLNVCTTGG